VEIAGQIRTSHDLRRVNAIANACQHITWHGQQPLAAHGGQRIDLGLKWIVHF
jgi:hypothetical protein